MTDDADGSPPGVPILCAECETAARVPLPEVRERLDRHNDRLHDGEAVARVDPELADRLADLVAEDLGLL